MSGWLNTASITASASAPAAIREAPFSGVMPPMATIGIFSTARAARSSCGVAGPASARDRGEGRVGLNKERHVVLAAQGIQVAGNGRALCRSAFFIPVLDDARTAVERVARRRFELVGGGMDGVGGRI